MIEMYWTLNAFNAGNLHEFIVLEIFSFFFSSVWFESKRFDFYVPFYDRSRYTNVIFAFRKVFITTFLAYHHFDFTFGALICKFKNNKHKN